MLIPADEREELPPKEEPRGWGGGGRSAGTDNADAVASVLASRLLWLGSRSLGRQFLGWRMTLSDGDIL